MQIPDQSKILRFVCLRYIQTDLIKLSYSFPLREASICAFIAPWQKQALNLKNTLQLGNGGFKVSLVLHVESGTHQ